MDGCGRKGSCLTQLAMRRSSLDLNKISSKKIKNLADKLTMII